MSTSAPSAWPPAVSPLARGLRDRSPPQSTARSGSCTRERRAAEHGVRDRQRTRALAHRPGPARPARRADGRPGRRAQGRHRHGQVGRLGGRAALGTVGAAVEREAAGGLAERIVHLESPHARGQVARGPPARGGRVEHPDPLRGRRGRTARRAGRRPASHGSRSSTLRFSASTVPIQSTLERVAPEPRLAAGVAAEELLDVQDAPRSAAFTQRSFTR